MGLRWLCREEGKKKRYSVIEIFRYFDIKQNFKIIKLPTLDLFGFLPEKAAFWLQLFSFSLILTVYCLFKYLPWRPDLQVVFFSHDHIPLWFLSFFAKNIFYDIHHFPDQNFFYRRVLRKAFGFAVQTKWKLKALEEEFGLDPKNIVYWPNGVDIAKFNLPTSRADARARLHLPQEKPLVVYTGQLFDWKGTETMIEAAKLLKGVEFYIVGGGADDLIPNLHFAGQRPHSEIPLWLRAADALILPNTGKQKVSLYYTSPMKMFEYMASGTPIVASNIPSITEILNDTNAVLVEPDKPAALADGIRYLLGDPGFSLSLGKKSQENVQKYTWKKRAERISELFD